LDVGVDHFTSLANIVFPSIFFNGLLAEILTLIK
jgi:hypothetical protein